MTTLSSRRDFLIGAVALVTVPWEAIASDEAVAAAVREQIGADEIIDGGIALRVPPVAENGGQVPVSILVDTPQNDESHAIAIHVFATRNPTPGVTSFRLSPKLARAEVQTRIRLAQDQQIIVLAQMNDGRVRRVVADIRVTTGGCLS